MEPIYDFLDASILAEPKLLAANFKAVEEPQLRSALDAYYRLRVESCRDPAPDRELAVYADLRNSPARSIATQCALYIEHLQLNDPLFSQALAAGASNEELKRGMGVSTRIDRAAMADSVRTVLYLRPAIEAGYIWLHPGGRRVEPLPALETKNNYYDLLPRDQLDFYRARARVRRVVVAEGRALVMADRKPSRLINIQFDGLPRQAMGFTLGQITGQTPTFDEFAHFVDGCKNRAAWMLQHSIVTAMNRASARQLRYFTDSPLIGDLIGPLNATKSSTVVTSLADSKLPYIDGIDLSTVVKIRRDDGEAFQDFRLVLERGLSELRQIEELEKRRTRAQEIFREIAEVNVRSVHKKFRSVRKQLALDGAMKFAGVAASIALPPVGTFLAAGLAVADFVGKLDKEETELRALPGFFLWKVGRRSRR